MLKAIGFWIEGLDDEEFPAPQEFVGPLPSDTRSRMVRYLDAGVTFETYRGYSWCRFSCGVALSHMGSRHLTDGTWLWPEGLSHYVKHHEVILPEDFMTHAQIGSPPRHAPQSEEIDSSFWIQWCAPRRSPSFLERLRPARHAAELIVAEAKRKHIEALILRRGLSEAHCLWRGCRQVALAGMSVCAEHSLSPGDYAIFKQATYTGFAEALQRASKA